MAKKTKVAKTTNSSRKEHEMSPVIQFAVVFIFIAAIALIAFVSKNYL